jgi:spermidine/putrescine transport system ATP-binding protein
MSRVKIQLKNLYKAFETVHNESDAVHAVDHINLDIYAGEFFALLGPSGCGKSTTLRLIAGFEQPTSGDILIDGQSVTDLPPYQRPVNTVFQDYALFPHMTILNNVMFGLRMEGVPRKEAQRRASEALELVQLPDVAKRKPNEISGGQQQRVALARALVKKPEVLLLDEPMGALDLKLRRQMQLELKALQRELGITFIFVTHDQEEAMTMANRIAVMNAGQVLQIGRPNVIYEHPVNRFVAAFVGETNFIEAQPVAGDVVVGNIPIPMPEKAAPTATDQPITLAIRPERIQLHPINHGAPTNGGHVHLKGRILDIHYIGTDIRYIVGLDDDQRLIVRFQNTDPANNDVLSINDVVRVGWNPAYMQILAT